MNQKFYSWTRIDKWWYFISMIPFALMFVGTFYLLVNYSIYLSVIWVVLYIIVNIFQAGCCVGCPYRGKYCPAFCGVYLGNLLSGILYKDRQFDAKFYENNAAGGEISLVVFLIFPIYWIFRSGWYFIPIYVVLVVAHVFLFMPKQCAKCSYNTTCPGGKAYQSYCKFFRTKHSDTNVAKYIQK